MKKMTPVGQSPSPIEYLEGRCLPEQAKAYEDAVLREAVNEWAPDTRMTLHQMVVTCRTFLPAQPTDTRGERHQKRLFESMLKALEALEARWAGDAGV
jgi:hypothetical protein